MNISIGKLLEQVEKRPEINEEDALVRELLEICFLNRTTCTVEELSKYNSRIFMKVYEEIFKMDIEEKRFIKDMMSAEYLTENLKSTQQYVDDEDEIY
ncbi:hypothetical protein GKZ28_08410 [Clostridium chromiireducens]|jgi:hypothetical protein|uniref:Uncharacterized protein n=1 Tax=Clostridium chromiireducens TaxID=225345 RepID=A0A964RL91_9CLOT|nr:hypothetical protein [Clostridium chromiireducens]MVX63717.1 hypothetical protein [Clostridium chromiireducens]